MSVIGLPVGLIYHNEDVLINDQLQLVIQVGKKVVMMESGRTREDMIWVVKEWISLWNPPVDWDKFDALHAEDFKDYTPAGRAGTKKGFAQGLKEFTSAFPDLRTRVEDIIVDESRKMAAVRWSASGTNRKNYLGVGPTNKKTTITGIEIVEIRWGRVSRRWGEWDISDHIKQGQE